MREVNGGVSDESARTSLKREASPSRFAVLAMGRAIAIGACGSYGEKSRPPGDKGGNTGSALGHGGTARPRPCEQADEGGSFGTPATTDFKTEHNQAAPTGVGELGVGTLCCPASFSQLWDVVICVAQSGVQ